MKISDRLKRAVAFYFSVALFLILLPITLSYALGYKIDYHAFKIYKTGIIYINSTPSGGYIYVNGSLHKDVTPAQIEELKPGIYRIEVRRSGFYPWEKDLEVRPNMVTKADRILLFPMKQEMNKISWRETSDFFIPGNGYIYYFTRYGLFKSNIDGATFQRLSSYTDWPRRIMGKRLSSDGKKLLYFDKRSVWVVYLDAGAGKTAVGETAKVEEALIVDHPIIDVFWHSASSYIIIITNREISAAEAKGGIRNLVSLYKFNTPPSSLHYDENNDSLYFTDSVSEPAKSGQTKCLYRLDLRQNFFDELLQRLLKKEAE